MSNGETAMTEPIKLPNVAFCKVSDISITGSHEEQLGVSADTKLYTADQVRAAIEADRQHSKRNLKYRDLYVEALERCERLEADRQRRGEPVAWINEDELADSYPYDEMFGFSEVRGGVRMFPVFWPDFVITPDYLDGHRHGLEWAAQIAEANHPLTGDWLYDDPHELAKALRKGPEMPPATPQPAERDDRSDWCRADGCSHKKAGSPVWETQPAEPVKVPSDEAIEVIKLALEYWSDRQQRYKNRAPVWVQDARAILAKYGQAAQRQNEQQNIHEIIHAHTCTHKWGVEFSTHNHEPARTVCIKCGYKPNTSALLAKYGNIKKCDGNHAIPRCADPECWNDSPGSQP